MIRLAISWLKNILYKTALATGSLATLLVLSAATSGLTTEDNRRVQAAAAGTYTSKSAINRNDTAKTAGNMPQEPYMTYDEMYQMMLKEQQEVDRQYFAGIAAATPPAADPAQSGAAAAPAATATPAQPVAIAAAPAAPAVAYQPAASPAVYDSGNSDKDDDNDNRGRGRSGRSNKDDD